VPWQSKPLRLTPTGLVLAPLALLTVIVAILLFIVAYSSQVSVLSPTALMVSGACAYAAAIIFLSRRAIASVRELETLGRIDGLSGLPDRHLLSAALAEKLGGDEELALALIDLDAFKNVNDHFGHDVGDELIRQCAARLREVCGNEAVSYRLSGDEFAVVMCGPVAGTILEGICRTLLAQLAMPIEVGARSIVVGASIGLARRIPGQHLEVSELLRRSDVGMYMSKRAGKMRCTWFSESFDERREAVRQIEEDLRKALNEGQFEVHYQPLVDARSGYIIAVEALLRWDRPDGAEMGPAEFIPIAEESGIINAIGLWVLREAMTTARRWSDTVLSVNLSAAQLRNPEFPIKLGEILEDTGFAPDQLELEVTETSLVVDPVLAERSLELIRTFGVRISLDDFGTGYASIGFLRQFHFEKLKLDRSLVEQASKDEGSRAMMLSSITVARALGMDVTAEGVETSEQADLLRLAGCDQMQGYLYHKPLPADEIDRLMAAQADASSPVGSARTDQMTA
jgi:diguanylate cyclase (GGDEF)-like protein